MFGRDWEKAEATVIARQFAGGDRLRGAITYVLEVRAGDREPFRVELGPPSWDFSYPAEGAVVGVLYHDASATVRFDQDDPRTSEAGSGTGRLVASLGPAGSFGTAAAFAAILRSGAIAELIREAQSDPVGFRERLLARVQAAGAAPASAGAAGASADLAGASAGVAGASDEVAGASAGVAGASDGVAGAPATAADKPGVLDQIAKLADLRDEGVLTDEEFQQAKSKLLAGR